MNSVAFGPPTWRAMFFIAAGYDVNPTPKKIKDPQYEMFFRSLGGVLPCKFCRDSYKQFYEELDINKYFGKRCGLMRFVYDMKNKVNEKLIKQEQLLLQEKRQELKKAITQKEKDKIKLEMKKIKYTKPAPPFDEVVAEYEKHRAGCSKKLKSCRKI
jgi:hypothetical protein